MPPRHHALTPEALTLVETIARAGSFAAASRLLDKVPSALTYNVRQLKESLDVLLFDRSTRQAKLTAAGKELLREGRRLLTDMETIANRVRRVATGWESQLAIATDGVLSSSIVFELCDAFYAATSQQEATAGTQLRLRTEILTGTWEALVSGQVDLAIGVTQAPRHPLVSRPDPLSDIELQAHRAVAVADSALRLAPATFNLLAGQDVLTVGSLQAKLEAQLRGLGCGFLPEPLARRHVETGHLVLKKVQRDLQDAKLAYAWRQPDNRTLLGRGLQWWLPQLAQPHTRAALLSHQST